MSDSFGLELGHNVLEKWPVQKQFSVKQDSVPGVV